MILAIGVSCAQAEPVSPDYLTGTGGDESASDLSFQQRSWLAVPVDRSENLGPRASYWLKARPSLGFSAESLGRKKEGHAASGSRWLH